MPSSNKNDNAVRTELVESICDELVSVRKVVPTILEEHLIAAAYQSARKLGWGEDESELKCIFRHVAACLRWPVPNDLA